MKRFIWILLLLSACMHRDPDLAALLLTPAARAFVFTAPELPEGSPERSLARDRIVHAIASARTRIVMYCYDLDEPLIVRELLDAEARGVSLRITGSPDQTYQAPVEAGLALQIRPRSGLQHAKLLLIDDTVLITGTGNFSESDLFHNHNAFFFYDVSAEKAREIENALLREALDAPVVKGLPFSTTLLVSPAKGRLIQSILLQRVLSAKTSIRYLIYSQTDPVLTDALYSAAARGVLLEGVYDQGSLGPDSEGRRLSDSLSVFPGVIYEEGNRSVFETEEILRGGKLHHKTMIIDDSIVLTGSYNFSMNARDANQEVFLEIRDPWAALHFRDEFDRIANRARPLGRSAVTATPPELLGPDPYCGGPGRLTVFYGRGASFAADHFQTDSSCAFIEERTIHSAGIASGRSFQVTERDELRVHNLASVSKAAGPHLPEGIPGNVRQISRTSLWVNAPGCIRMTVLNRSGVSRVDLMRSAEGFYTFASIPASDSLLWLECEQTYVACAKTGLTVDTPVQAYLDAMEYEGGSAPACVNLE